MLTALFRQKFNQDMLIAATLFALALVYYLVAFGSETQLHMPNAYQARDIRRALDLYAMKWIWHGPELSGGGHLPGPFYYLLIGLPLKVFGTFRSLYFFEFSLAAATASFMWYVLKRNFSVIAGSIFYIIFLLSPFMIMNLMDFMNPSFIFFPLSLAFWCFVFLRRPLGLFVGSFLLGLCIQIHFVAAILLLAVVLETIGSKATNRKKFKDLLCILLFFLLPLLPYFYYRLFILESTSTYYHFSSAFLKFLHVFRIIYHDRPSELITVNSLWRLFKFLLMEIWFFPALAVVILSRKEMANQKILRNTLIIGVIPFLATLDRHLNFRYNIPLFFGLAVAAAIYLPRYFKKFPHFIIAAVSFTLLRLWNLAPPPVDPTALPPMTVAEGKIISEKVIAVTGWDYNYFKLHTFVDDLNNFDDFSVVYRELYPVLIGNKVTSGDYDGVLMSSKKPPAFPETISRALSEGEIKCVKEDFAGRFQLCYYTFSDARKKRRWHNLTFAYDSPERPANPGVVRNECRQQDPSCDIAFNLDFAIEGWVKVQITGDPLTVVDPFNNPTMGAYLNRPQIQIDCPGFSKTYVITNNVGMFRKGFMAPFDEYFELPCRNPQMVTFKVKEGFSTFQTAALSFKTSNNFIPYEIKWTGPLPK